MNVDTCISNELSYETSRKCWNVFDTLFKAMLVASGLKRSQSQSYGSDSKWSWVGAIESKHCICVYMYVYIVLPKVAVET